MTTTCQVGQRSYLLEPNNLVYLVCEFLYSFFCLTGINEDTWEESKVLTASQHVSFIGSYITMLLRLQVYINMLSFQY